jgi:hypothetical protein
MILSLSRVQVRSSLLLFLFPVLSLPLLSQNVNPAIKKLAGQLDSLGKKNASELVYIQTNKGIYESLEDLWFKAYILDSHTFVPSTLSQTLYLQLLNENTRQVVWQEKYEVLNGFVDGHVFLQDTLSVGDYLLAAFTPNSFFGDSSELKAIRRIQLRKELKANYDGWKEPRTLTVPFKNGPIQFNTFPEGGNMVSGVMTRLAFKAVKTDGMPPDIEGTLFEDTVPLVKFKSVRAGMGSFEFTPLAGKKYNIRLASLVTNSAFLLPQVYQEGITMHLAARDKEFLEFIVSQCPPFQNKKIYLRGQIRGVVYCIATGVLINELKIKIPLKEFPCQGIAEFTLFNDSLIPVAERLVYINPGKNLQIETWLNKEKYETREKATLKIAVKDENGQPVRANLGVRVYDKLYQNSSDAENILTHCYLTSQLKGKIYDPGYYFDPKNEDREETLDLLLLTQGWCRYVWGQTALKENANTNKQVILDGVEGEVHATAKLKKALKLQQIVMAYYPGKNENIDLIPVDSAGKFMVTSQHLKTWQGSYVYLKPGAPPEFEPRISLSDPFKTINEIRKIKEINYPLSGPKMIKKEEDFVDPYVEGHKTIKLDEVTVTARGTTIFRDKYIGYLDSVTKLDLNRVWVCKHGYLENYRPGYSHGPSCHGNDGDTAKPKPIEGKQYRVIKYEYVPKYGGVVVTDVFNMIWHYPKFTEEELLQMNNLSRVKAYYPHREFYQPNYDKETGGVLISDFRNTLVWAPSVNTNEKGEATVEFFCSDLNTGFVGRIEGVSGEGLVGTEDFEFTVLKTKSIRP